MSEQNQASELAEMDRRLQSTALEALGNMYESLGVRIPVLSPSDFDRFLREFLLPGAEFHRILEKSYWIGAFYDFATGKSGTPFASPFVQIWGLQRFIGFCLLAKYGQI